MSSQTPIYPVHQQAFNTVNRPLSSNSVQEHNAQHPAQYFNMQAHGSNFQSMDFNAQTIPTTPPRTPQRSEHNRNNNTRLQNMPESSSKSKQKNKHRPKHVSTSSTTISADRKTPPLTNQSSNMPQSTRPISTPSTAAYAGPTFHASPAPSALPIPSFYSKSVPESPGINALLKARKDAVPSSGGNSPSPPAVKATATTLGREESPLDFIFNAHREERVRSATGSGGPFDLPAVSPQNRNMTPVSNHHQPSRSPHFSGGASSSMFAMDLDGNTSPGKPYGPAFSTPYSERINAARTTSSSDQDSQSPSLDRSQALKDFLFSQSPKQQTPRPVSFQDIPKQSPTGTRTSSTPLRAHHNSYPRHHEGHGSTLPRTGNRASGLRREVEITPTKITPESLARSSVPHYDMPVTPSRTSRVEPPLETFTENTPSNHAYQQYAQPSFHMPTSSGATDLRGMEDSLRRILKLEPVSDQNSLQGHENKSIDDVNTGLGNMPAATASVPNYVGGRAPPMNGLHNGVMGS